MFSQINEFPAALSTSYFVKIALNNPPKAFMQPQGILVLDLDDTILNFVESCNRKETIYYYEESLRELIQFASKQNYLVVVATARSLQEEKECPSYIQGVSCLTHLSSDISEIYFTSMNSKKYVLEYLNDFYLNGLPENKKRILIVDDQPNNVYECLTAGFSAVQVDPSSSRYLQIAREFLADTNRHMTI